MLVHKFIDGKKPVMVLIHGVLTPWQIWTPQIESFREKYNIYSKFWAINQWSAIHYQIVYD